MLVLWVLAVFGEVLDPLKDGVQLAEVQHGGKPLKIRSGFRNWLWSLLPGPPEHGQLLPHPCCLEISSLLCLPGQNEIPWNHKSKWIFPLLDYFWQSKQHTNLIPEKLSPIPAVIKSDHEVLKPFFFFFYQFWEELGKACRSEMEEP